MAELAEGRVYKRKRITCPTNEDLFIDIPVIYEMKFKAMSEQAQERWLYIDNSENSSRKVHTKRVFNVQDDSQYVDVERIDEWYAKEMQSQAQELAFIMKNNDPPPIQPDGRNNPAHEKVHYVRYFPDNDAGSDSYLDVELIDELKIMDMVSQAQEWIYYIKHPELGDTIDDPDVPYVVTVGYCDPSLPLDTGTQ